MLTARHLNRATLARQMLLEREEVSVVEAVGRLVGLQAQEPAAQYLALWNRIAGFDPADLDAAFADGSVVKASLMRLTLHAVRREDYTTFHEAMAANLRASRVFDRRFKATALTPEDADRLLPLVVEFAREPRSKDEFEAMLAGHVEPEPRLWWAYRTFAPLVHVPGDDTWSFGSKQRFMAAPTVPARDGSEASLQRLVVRYLEAFGPASPVDFAQFTMQSRADARAAFAALGDALITHETADGETLFDVPGRPLPDSDTPAPVRLAGMWESTLLAYADRSRVIPNEHRPTVIRRNGDVLPTVWVDGHVAGIWRATPDGIEVHPLESISDEAWAALEHEAAALAESILARDPAVFSRYDHWWAKEPAKGRRLLA